MSETPNWTNTRSLWPEPFPDHAVSQGTELVAGVEIRWFVCLNLHFRTSVRLEYGDGSWAYQDASANTGPTPTTNWDKAEPFVDGWVKFDGCYHLNFGDGGYMHLCGQHGMNQLAMVLNRIRALASQHTEIDW